MNIPDEHLSIIETERLRVFRYPVRDFFIDKEKYDEYDGIEGELHISNIHVASVIGVDDGDKYIRFRFFEFDPDHIPFFRLDLLRVPVEFRLRLFANDTDRPRIVNCQFFSVSCFPLDIFGDEGDTRIDVTQAVYFAGNHGLVSIVRFYRGLICPLYNISSYIDVAHLQERQKLVKRKGDYVRMLMSQNVFDAAFDAINGDERWNRHNGLCAESTWLSSKEEHSMMSVNSNITILYTQAAEHSCPESTELVNVYVSFGPSMRNCVFDFPVFHN